MAIELIIRGGAQFGAVAAAFREAAAGGLRMEVARSMQAGASGLEDDARAGTDRLPQSGGLAAIVAGSRFSTRPTLGGLGVRIEAFNSIDIAAIDAGTVHHPVWGRGPDVAQSVVPGWFTAEMESNAPSTMRGFIEAAVRVVAHQIEGSA